MFKSHERISGRQNTRWIAFLLAALFAPIAMLATAPHSIFVIGLTLLASILFFRFAWVHRTKHSQLTIPTLNLP